MTNSQAEIAAQLLVDLGFGTDPLTFQAWPVYSTAEPSAPDNCITVKDTDGTSEGRSMVDGELQEHFGVQVRVRSTTHPTGWQKALAVREALAKNLYDRTVTIGSSQYLVHCAAKISRVLSLGKDTPSTKRSIFTVNAVLALTSL